MTLNAMVASCKSQEPFFSWSSCEECGDTKGGNRYEIEYRTALDGGKFTAEVCESCMVDLCG